MLVLPLLGFAAAGVLVAGIFDLVPSFVAGAAAALLVGVLVRLGLSYRASHRLLQRTRIAAETDPLTGLLNRRSLVSDLERCLEEASRDNLWLLVTFDLDGFKNYNDTFGHPAGDTLLARMGAKLARVPAGSGGAYRLGGDEFCVLAPVRSPAEAVVLVDAAVNALAEQGEGFAVTSSFGAVLLPDDADAAGGALLLADERLYMQKRGKQTARDRPHEMLLAALYERDPSIQEHLEGVATLAVDVGRSLGLDERELLDLHRAAQLHDIGTIAVPDDILQKPGPLTDDEWQFVQQHTVVGERILSASPILREVGRLVRSTHERFDGTGYPDGLAGDAIPLAARIVFACHAFDSMVQPRTFRDALQPEDALRELRRCSGTQFDPVIVRHLSGVIERQIAPVTR
ncbi:MAG: diguanylate cyclase [Actinobacteria bacterium]|nr:diguanylate cyclase [Actinomycetota bacterium]